MAKMRVVQISRRGGPLEMAEREIPQPRAGTVRMKVEACGLCHTDMAVVAGLLPGIEYPRVPGHEVAGFIDAKAPFAGREQRRGDALALARGHGLAFEGKREFRWHSLSLSPRADRLCCSIPIGIIYS